MMIDGPEEWKLPESEQTPREDRTSTGQVQDKLHTDNPAIAEGYVRLLYPDKPRHPRQRYLLTVKGLALYKTVISQGRVR